MATAEGDFLVQAATYLGAAAIAVPIFNRFKLGSILGYLAAGVIAGPHMLDLLHQEEGVFHIAELGVVLFLFVIGLELSLTRLWSMRKQIFGLGAAQMGITGAVIAGFFVAAGVMPMNAAIIAGLSFAFSSTAFALQLLRDRGEQNSPYGARSFSILLFQDLAVIPLLAAIPFIAGAGGDGADWTAAAKAIGVLVALVVIGKYALDPMFRLVAGSGSREAFAATALFLVALTSLAVSWAGLSMALGAFLAGALLAESSYRHQIETDIEPFRGLLLGLFFISIGMRLDLNVIAQYWWIVFAGAVGLVAIKAGLLFVVARFAGAARGEAMKTAAVLSQGGEFAFVVISLGVSASLFSNGESTLMSAIITVSMALTPAVLALAMRFSNDTVETSEGLEEAPQKQDHVIVAGFGRMGQIISQVLNSSGADVTAIDKDPGHIRNAQRFGFKVYFGDASRLDILLTAGALEAKAIIFCMDDTKAVNQAVTAMRERCPQAVIIAVAHDRVHEIELRPLGADFIVRETMESSLLAAREALSRMGHDSATIEDYVQQFRKLDRERLLAQVDAGPEAGMEFLHKPFVQPERRDSDG
ncbi:MAG: potassium transporter TrkA [Marinicaulis sp.]|nr:potassium transporter TrkA [Marinicaulis sp.]